MIIVSGKRTYHLDSDKESRRYDIDVCPLCSSEKMSLIPLANDEIYELSFRSNGGGLDMRFSKQVDRPDH
jgi:hypothetical protein